MVINSTKIQIILAERGMTWSQLAALSGVSRQNVSVVLRRRTCTPKTAGKLAQGLGVPVSEIINLEEDVS